MGLRLNVYRAKDDSGWPSDDVSGAVDHITVINVEGPFEPSDAAPAYMLERHHYFLTAPVLSPVDLATGQSRGGMASGNYAGKGDRRWSDAVSAITGTRFWDLVAIHDRCEGGGR